MLTHPNSPDLTPKSEIDRRIDGLRAKMAGAGIDYAIILQNVDLFYFTGTVQKGVLVVSLQDGPVFLVERSVDRAVCESPLPVTPIKRDKDAKDILIHLGILRGKGGMELDVVPVALFERWKGILGFDSVGDVSPLIRDIRTIKSPFEVAQMRKAGEISTHVFARAKDVVKEGMREVDISAILDAEGRQFGHQGLLRMRGFNQEMMNLHVSAGLSATMPSYGDVPISGIGVTHATAQGPSFEVVRRDVPLVIDYGSGYNGYIVDETRAYVVGKLMEPFNKAYEVAREIIEDAMAYGKEGADGTDLFNRALAIAEKAKLGDYFMGYGAGKVSFVGHGVGLEVNELPVITPRHSTILREGMVFALEPKFVFPHKGAMGLELDFIVEQHSLERVTETTLDLIHL
jgi:Xaa-Pro dipeptidase